jgi:hypothetical protein
LDEGKGAIRKFLAGLGIIGALGAHISSEDEAIIQRMAVKYDQAQTPQEKAQIKRDIERVTKGSLVKEEDVAESYLNEWTDPGAPCAHCGLPHGQHRIQFNKKNPKVRFMNQDDEWNDLEMKNSEDHTYTPSKGYRPLSQREAELVGFDNLNVDIPNDIYDRINSVRQRLARVGKGAGKLTRVKEQGVAEGSEDELNARPGMWRGDAKRMTSKGKPTKDELGMQDNLKNRIKSSNKKGGLTGPKGVLPEEQGVEEDLDANQKRVGQLGPYEKVGPKGAVGKLVGASESFINTVDQAVTTEGVDELAVIKRLLGK